MLGKPGRLRVRYGMPTPGRRVDEPAAGTWKPWVLTSAGQIKVPPPPKAGSAEAKAELAEVKDLATKRTPQITEDAHHWSDYPALEP